MIIKKDSWHFRLMGEWNRRAATKYEYRGGGLCDYFWSVVYALISATIVCSASLALILVVLYLLVVAPLLMFWVPAMVEPGSIGIIIWLFTAVASGMAWLHHKFDTRKRAAPKPDGLLKSYIKARKEKFCPTIKVE